tara:strand:- start:232 stop:1107 length:876 start_codon:yes stop_codon:yes gene_type:complete
VISGTWKHFLFNITTCILTYIAYHFLKSPHFEISILIPSILGTALAFFIGFNNNQSYDRWWEARKIWGALVNDSRTWARQIVYFPGTNGDEEKYKVFVNTAVHRHIAFLYALKQSLRKSDVKEYKKYLSNEDVATIASEANKANALLSLQTRDLNEFYKSGGIDGFRFSEMNKMLVNFSDEMGKSERIANTVFPTSYNFYNLIFIWFFIVFATLFTAQTAGSWSILAGTLIGYVFLTIHKIGLSLLNPFEDIPTGISLNQITRTIEINMLQTLKKNDIPSPIESVNGEYVM